MKVDLIYIPSWGHLRLIDVCSPLVGKGIFIVTPNERVYKYLNVEGFPVLLLSNLSYQGFSTLGISGTLQFFLLKRTLLLSLFRNLEIGAVHFATFRNDIYFPFFLTVIKNHFNPSLFFYSLELDLGAKLCHFSDLRFNDFLHLVFHRILYGVRYKIYDDVEGVKMYYFKDYLFGRLGASQASIDIKRTPYSNSPVCSMAGLPLFDILFIGGSIEPRWDYFIPARAELKALDNCLEYTGIIYYKPHPDATVHPIKDGLVCIESQIPIEAYVGRVNCFIGIYSSSMCTLANLGCRVVSCARMCEFGLKVKKDLVLNSLVNGGVLLPETWAEFFHLITSEVARD